MTMHDVATAQKSDSTLTGGSARSVTPTISTTYMESRIASATGAKWRTVWSGWIGCASTHAPTHPSTSSPAKAKRSRRTSENG
jgi:hypothetical protein